MGRRPVTARNPGRSLGAIGRTTLADATVGGGHDDLIRRALQQGGTEWAGSRGGRVQAGVFTEDIVGAGATGIYEDLVPDSWDPDQPCMVTVTGLFQAGYASQQVTPPTTPATYVTPPTMIMVLVDGDDDAVTEFGETNELAATIWPVEEDPSDTTALGHEGETLSWLFLRGKPRLLMWCNVSAGAAPGLSPTGGNQRIAAITRVARL